MMLNQKTIGLLLWSFLLLFHEVWAQETPLSQNGRLSVCGTQLCNAHGFPIQLRGISTHGLQWYGWGDCITDESLDAIKNDWGADIVRVSMYIQEDGYETNPQFYTDMVDTIVENLYQRGLYALIDFHMLDPGDPNYNLERAKTFFSHVSATHGAKGNVLYEIANEPNGVYWSSIKTYADQVIPVIRANDPDGIVIVGTPDWSSLGYSGTPAIDSISNNPIDDDDVMYTFHFYAASHGQYYRTGFDQASDILPLFVTEFGTQNYAGEETNDFVSTELFFDIMDEKKISWINWNFSDDWRSGAVLKTGSCAAGEWTGDALKEAGTWIQNKMLNPSDDFPGGSTSLQFPQNDEFFLQHQEHELQSFFAGEAVEISLFSADGQRFFQQDVQLSRNLGSLDEMQQWVQSQIQSKPLSMQNTIVRLRSKSKELNGIIRDASFVLK